MWWLFHGLIAGHIAVGATGLVAFWVPVLGRKGSANHRRWGKVFVVCMLATGGFATGMSLCSLAQPLETHPHLTDIALIRGIFGWMMLYLSILTINLAWYGWQCNLNKRNHAANRDWRNLALQGLVTASAAQCAWQGWLIGQPLMLGMSIVGFATAATNLGFIYAERPGPKDWLKEHVKALVGAGISVYTAFFAFGAVRLMPELALQPALWAVPLTVGLALIIHHRRAIDRATSATAARTPPPLAQQP
jgi:uncharacterized membrane protein